MVFDFPVTKQTSSACSTGSCVGYSGLYSGLSGLWTLWTLVAASPPSKNPISTVNKTFSIIFFLRPTRSILEVHELKFWLWSTTFKFDLSELNHKLRLFSEIWRLWAIIVIFNNLKVRKQSAYMPLSYPTKS